MKQEISIYLDLVRFSAALLVLVYHTYGRGITGGFLWQISSYGHTAVIVFFVLSGYVIGFVAHSKEKTISEFLAARASRLYSVVFPAVILTFACNEFGRYFILDIYNGPWNEDEPNKYLRYIAALLMLQNIWGVDLSPTNNGVFWSLSYEFFYYLFFATLFYMRGKRKIILLFLLAAIAGPAIVSLFPIWGLGYLAYRFHFSNKVVLHPKVALLLFILSLIILIASPTYRGLVNYKAPVIRGTALLDYIDGIAFFVHLLVAPIVVKKISKMLVMTREVIVFMSSMTFSLYLFHLPLVRLFAGISPFIDKPSSYANIIFVYLMTIFVILLLGIPVERSKYWYKKWFRGIFDGVGQR